MPGRVVCVSADSGGYTEERGFSADSSAIVRVVDVEPVNSDAQRLEDADSEQNGEQLSVFYGWKTIACHTAEVAQAAKDIAQEIGLSDELQDILELAALWHDWGKAHPAFQGSIRSSNTIQRIDRNDLAKAPKGCWPKKHRYSYLESDECRPAFRHELASALGLFAVLKAYAPKHAALLGPWCDLPLEIQAKLGLSLTNTNLLAPSSPLVERLLNCTPEVFDLVSYLVASHHGKVRVGLHAAPQDQEYRDQDERGLPIRGIRQGDQLPSVVLVPGEPAVPEVTLTLSAAAIGLSSETGISWRERCEGLVERHGPAAVAFGSYIASGRRARFSS